MSDPRFEREQISEAQREAAEVGGGAVDDAAQAERPVREAGGGVSEGFEEAESLLVEHASHGDQQSAHSVLHHRGEPEEQEDEGSDDPPTGDHEHSAAKRP